MIKLNIRQIQEILNEKAVAENGINDVLEMTLNAIMYAEEQAILQSQKGLKNKTSKPQSSGIGGCGRQLSLTIPRSRLGVFKPLLLYTLEQERAKMDRLSYELYTSGLPTAKIEDILKKVYGEKSEQTVVSGVGQTLKREWEKWRTRALDSYYPVIYLDAIHIKVNKRGKVEGETFYVVLAVKEDYTRDIIALYNSPSESLSGWEEVLKKIRKRGVQKINLVVANNLKSLEDKVATQYPKASFQKCITQFRDEILSEVKPEDRVVIREELKNIFDTTDKRDTKEEAYERVNRMGNRWIEKYPAISEMLKEENLRNYFTYLDFNFKIWPMINKTKVIAQFNEAFKKRLKRRSVMTATIETGLLVLSGTAYEMGKANYSYPLYNFKYDFFIKKTK